LIELLTIRHAPVDADGICYGQHDVPTLLSAREVFDRIVADVDTFGPLTIWSSDAARCREPAAMLASGLGVGHVVDERIRELSYGAWEGKAWDDVPQAVLDEWMTDWFTKSPPGGETVMGLAERVRSWWTTLEPGAHFLMAHAGVVHCLDVVAGGMAWEETMRFRLDYLESRRFRRNSR
jgi:alpha-ribazole phosphatase